MRRVVRFSRHWLLLLAAAPLLQLSACTSTDLQSLVSVGIANFTINQLTVAAGTVIDNLFGV